MDLHSRYFSKRIYGNNTDPRYNLLGQLILGIARTRSGDIDYQGGLFDIPSSEGTLKDSVNVEAVEEFREEFDKYIEDEGVERETPSGEIRQRVLTDDIFDFIEKGLDYREIFPEKAEKAIEQAYGSHYKVISIKAYRNYHVEQEDVEESKIGGLPQLWHVDSFSPSFLRLFVPLHDVTKIKGPTQYVSKADTRRILQKNSMKEYALEPDIVEENAEIMEFDVEKGSAYLLNVCQHMHRARIPEPGEQRDIVVFNIVPDISEEPKFEPNHENILGYRKGNSQLNNLLFD